MKIAHLISQFYPILGGAEICVHNICRTLSENGHDAAVVTTVPPTPDPPPVPYDILRLSPRTGGLFRRWPPAGAAYLRHAVGRIQRRHEFDLWQVTMGYPVGAYIIDYFRSRGIPCLLRCCGEDIQKFPEINYGYRLDDRIDRLTTAKYPLFDGHIALTPSVRDEYLAVGVPEEKIRIIPNGVDTARFRDTDGGDFLRKKFNAPASAKVILSVGRHHPKKGYDLIPGMAAELKERGIEFIWVIVGRGAEAFNAKFPAAAELGVHTAESAPAPDDRTFALPSRDLVRMYKSADIFAFPTLLETFGMVLVEAMAAGLPILTTDAPGVCDVVEDGENGLKVPAGDAAAFSGLLTALLTDDAMRDEYAAKSLAAAERYDWNRVTAEYLDFYRQVITGNNPS